MLMSIHYLSAYINTFTKDIGDDKINIECKIISIGLLRINQFLAFTGIVYIIFMSKVDRDNFSHLSAALSAIFIIFLSTITPLTIKLYGLKYGVRFFSILLATSYIIVSFSGKQHLCAYLLLAKWFT